MNKILTLRKYLKFYRKQLNQSLLKTILKDLRLFKHVFYEAKTAVF